MKKEEIKQKLKESRLRITPQRMAVLEAVIVLHNHPTAEDVCGFIRQTYPNIATGTVYKVLETLVEKDLIQRVKTDRDLMRYDAVHRKHHHLYCAESQRIEDFYDETLDKIIDDYLKKKIIRNFKIEDIKLQIVGKFTDKSPQSDKTHA